MGADSGEGAVVQTDVRGAGVVPIVVGRPAQLAEVTSGGVAPLLLLTGWRVGGLTDDAAGAGDGVCGRRMAWCRCGDKRRRLV